MLMSSQIFEIVATLEFRLPRFDEELSKRFWGEARFPIILGIKNVSFTGLMFRQFSERLGFDPKYHMRGNTMKLGTKRMHDAGFATARELSQWCRSFPPVVFE